MITALVKWISKRHEQNPGWDWLVDTWLIPLTLASPFLLAYLAGFVIRAFLKGAGL